MAEDPDVSAWLAGLGLERFAGVFGDAQVDFETLSDLTGADLRELGVEAVGSRRRLESAIARLRDERSAVSPDVGDLEARRHLTILFCDVVGSTALSRRCDPEQMSLMFRDVFAVMGRVIRRRHGHEANRLGDGALIYFGYPHAQEHAALQAALTGCELVEEIGRLVRDPEGNPVVVRAGIASGMVVVNRADAKSVFGDTPNIAARVQALALPGEVLVAESTRVLIRGLVVLEPRGAHSMKGVADPVSVWRVLPDVNQGPSTTATRTLSTPIVGREGELVLLGELWNAASAGRGEAVCVSGEAGIGKSYLCDVFAEWAVGGDGLERRWRCSSDGVDSPFAPFIREAHGSLGVADLIDPKLAEALREPESRESLSLIRSRRESLIGGFVRRALAHDDAFPLLLRFEDAHWSDPSSLEVLARIIKSIDRLPVLLLITTREPDGVPGVGVATTMRLEPLGIEDTKRVVAATIDALDVATSEDLITEIAARADGVPFFAEELARSFAQASAIQHDTVASVANIPATLQEALQFRVDGLAVGADVLQLAAVVGRDVPLDVLAALVPDARHRDAALVELEETGLLSSSESETRTSRTSLTFRHQLIVEYVYDTIMRRDRASLHGRVADVLAGRLDVEPQTRAHHEERAGRAEAAARCWAQAGQRAASRSADAEAAAYFRRALALLSQFDDAMTSEEFEVEVLLAFLPTLLGSDGYVSAATASVNRVVELTARRNDPEPAFKALFLRWLDQLSSGGVDVAHGFAQELLGLAGQVSSETTPLLIDRMMGSTHMFRGELAEADRALERFARNFDADRHAAALSEYGATDNNTTVQCCRICVAALRGDRERSRALQASTIAQAEAMGRVHNLCHVLAYGGALGSGLLQDWDAMTRSVRRLQSVASEHDLPFWLADVDLFLGIEAVRVGDYGRGSALFDRGTDWFFEHGAGFLLPTFKVLYVSAAGVGANDPLELEVLDGGLDDGERWVRAELWRLRAGEELRLGHTAIGLDFLERSIALAKVQGAHMLVERSSAMLAGVSP